jgi:uncharacterized protein
MESQPIILDFGEFALDATLFDTEVARKFSESMPYHVKLTQWGNELYGTIGIDLGEATPTPEIPPGGLAYTNQGNYFCIFFGQTPAWAVEHIGRIDGDQWKRLLNESAMETVVVRQIP